MNSAIRKSNPRWLFNILSCVYYSFMQPVVVGCRRTAASVHTRFYKSSTVNGLPDRLCSVCGDEMTKRWVISLSGFSVSHAKSEQRMRTFWTCFNILRLQFSPGSCYKYIQIENQILSRDWIHHTWAKNNSLSIFSKQIGRLLSVQHCIYIHS